LENGKVVEDGSFSALQSNPEGYFQTIANGMKKQEQKEVVAEEDKDDL